MSMQEGDGLRFVEWVRARNRGKETAKRRNAETAIFREHFVGADEFQTAGYAKEAVAANLGAMRLAQARERGWQ